MNIEEKLDLIEKLVHAPKGSLTEETLLKDVEYWESLTITNFQIELIMHGKNVDFEELRDCKMVGELCRYFD